MVRVRVMPLVLVVSTPKIETGQSVRYIKAA